VTSGADQYRQLALPSDGPKTSRPERNARPLLKMAEEYDRLAEQQEQPSEPA
jgi:hypothetical protein